MRAVLAVLARPRPAQRAPSGEAECLPLTEKDISVDALQARRKVREILQREAN